MRETGFLGRDNPLHRVKLQDNPAPLAPSAPEADGQRPPGGWTQHGLPARLPVFDRRLNNLPQPRGITGRIGDSIWSARFKPLDPEGARSSSSAAAIPCPRRKRHRLDQTALTGVSGSAGHIRSLIWNRGVQARASSRSRAGTQPGWAGVL